jgi:hypothetical protein
MVGRIVAARQHSQTREARTLAEFAPRDNPGQNTARPLAIIDRDAFFSSIRRTMRILGYGAQGKVGGGGGGGWVSSETQPDRWKKSA